MKRVVIILLALLCSSWSGFAQTKPMIVNSVDDYGNKLCSADYKDLRLACSVNNKQNDVVYIKTISLGDWINSKYKSKIYLRIELDNSTLHIYSDRIDQASVSLSNGQRIMFRNIGCNLAPKEGLRSLQLYMLDFESGDNGETQLLYAIDQLVRYDITNIELYAEYNASANFMSMLFYGESIEDKIVVSFQPKFKSSAYIRVLVSELRKAINDTRYLPNVSGLNGADNSVESSQGAMAKSKTSNVKPSQTMNDADAIARADKRAVYLMEYANQINRKDYISPRELIYTPMALFTSRDIPMEAVQRITASAKGVKKCEIANDKFDSKVSVTPEGFYLRVRSYEAMPCRYMRVSYDNDNLSKIASLYFSYAMPKGWKKGDIAKYAKAISEDINILGAQMKKRSWSGGSIGYQCYYQGHTISIMYNTKYIKYSEPTISVLITYDKELK